MGYMIAPPTTPVRIGLDLGQLHDSTAIAVVEQAEGDDGKVRHLVRKLARLPLGTPYPAIVDHVEATIRNLEAMSEERKSRHEPGLSTTMIVDAGGVGRPVIDLLEERALSPVPVVTVGGNSELRLRDDSKLGYVVSKSLLVSNLLILIQTQRLTLPSGEETQALLKELQDFRVDTTAAGNTTYNARSGAHDDLISALSLATLPGVRRYEEPGQSWLAMRIARGGGNW